ncbi:hypothetical protein OKA04_06910 [Luteolibacter flavescens]|uniref:Uncharacterized protein n=1 Tax=Luteolibacter flavescens TaxID=1859460 RepID=A0ABT3FN94_9BACT|nr:hypothetical protein [Luteolibacter flavescens]MCW1884455.1 hypothetical protein [Luteolibacter flavescens]
MNLRNIAITSTFAVSGVALWSYGAARLAGGGDFDFRPNPLGLKTSPYGQVIALAMQGGIESDWHGTMEVGVPTAACSACGHHHGPDGDFCHTGKGGEDRNWIAKVELAATERTNPNPVTKGHQLYLRRQTEDRLRQAYELDPSNYANYNSYHLFLTEPSVGTRPILNDKVIELAQSTIKFSLLEDSDPRPSLTAAAAAGNILELMFLNSDKHTLQQMKEHLQLLDQSLAKNHELTEKWLASGEFENLSPARQAEMLERLRFVNKIREAAMKTIQRLEASESSQAVSSH